ncbi:MAG TPA: hypothetical protein VGU66_09070 [Candidatus Elarobacter sp.]|nr:hypothetical protein [Candidatus Elarobacter sp.]
MGQIIVCVVMANRRDAQTILDEGRKQGLLTSGRHEAVHLRESIALHSA